MARARQRTLPASGNILLALRCLDSIEPTRLASGQRSSPGLFPLRTAGRLIAAWGTKAQPFDRASTSADFSPVQAEKPADHPVESTSGRANLPKNFRFRSECGIATTKATTSSSRTNILSEGRPILLRVGTRKQSRASASTYSIQCRQLGMPAFSSDRGLYFSGVFVAGTVRFSSSLRCGLGCDEDRNALRGCFGWAGESCAPTCPARRVFPQSGPISLFGGACHFFPCGITAW